MKLFFEKHGKTLIVMGGMILLSTNAHASGVDPTVAS